MPPNIDPHLWHPSLAKERQDIAIDRSVGGGREGSAEVGCPGCHQSAQNLTSETAWWRNSETLVGEGGRLDAVFFITHPKSAQPPKGMSAQGEIGLCVPMV